MEPKETKFNLGWTFLIAVNGAVVPLLFNLFQVNWDFTEVDSHHYYLLALAAVSFFVAYQIVKRMKLPRNSDSFYLSVIGIYVLIFLTSGLAIAMIGVFL